MPLDTFLAMNFSNTFSAVDVNMHCQKAADAFLAVYVLFGVVCCSGLDLFGGGCGFLAVDVAFWR